MLLFDQKDSKYIITNKTNLIEQILTDSPVVMKIHNMNVTIGYISFCRQRSKRDKTYYGDITLNDKYSDINDIKIVSQYPILEIDDNNKKARMIGLTTYIEAVE